MSDVNISQLTDGALQRYFVHCAYCGTAYHGWQRQPHVISIQATMEDSLSQVLGMAISITGCGRTDARVHASQFFVHFDCDRSLDFDLCERWNRNLPCDIVVLELIAVHARAHARYEAVERTYDYYIHTQPNPFLTNLSAFYDIKNLDLSAMAKACSLLVSNSDYRGLCKTPLRQQVSQCNIVEAHWYRSKDGKRLRFQIRSNRFLRGMIRIIISEMILIGQGCPSSERLEPLLKGDMVFGDKALAPPQGLFLSEVRYPFIHVEPSLELFGPLGSEGLWERID